MSQTVIIPAVHARSLVSTVEAIRGETLMLKAAGLIGVCADDLLDGGGTVNSWLADLDDMMAATTTPTISLPVLEAWAMQHIVYSLSAVLVWAHEMRAEGRIATPVSVEAITAWAEVEQAAGLGGRTTMALGWSANRLIGREVRLPSGVEELADAAQPAA